MAGQVRGRQTIQSPGRIDARPLGVRMLRRQPRLHRYFGKIGIAEGLGPVAVGEAGSFDFQMQTFRRNRVHRCQIKPREDIEYLQGDDALAVGRAFIDIVAPVIGLDRRHIFAFRTRKIVHRVQPAPGFQEIHHVFGDGAFVKTGAAFLGNGLQRFRQ